MILIPFWLILIHFEWFHWIRIRFNRIHCHDAIGFQEFGSKKSIKSQFDYDYIRFKSSSWFNCLSFIDDIKNDEKNCLNYIKIDAANWSFTHMFTRGSNLMQHFVVVKIIFIIQPLHLWPRPVQYLPASSFLYKRLPLWRINHLVMNCWSVNIVLLGR